MDRRLPPIAALVVLVALVVAAPAAADSRMTSSRGILYYLSEDAGVANRLTVDRDGQGRAHFIDEADPAGINYPSSCSPGKLNNTGNAVEVFCDTAGLTSITIQTGPGEDQITYKIDDLPASIEGAAGADTLTAAGAADVLDGGQGNDRLDAGGGEDIVNGGDGDDTLSGGDAKDRMDGGAGADTVDAGAGDDVLRGADGVADKIGCGAGTDTVDADTLDALDACETVTRRGVAPPTGGSSGPDGRAPLLRVGGSTSQRVSSSRRTVSIAATVDEPAAIQSSGFLDAGGINSRLTPKIARVKVAGGGTQIRVTLSRAQARRVLADLRRHRRPKLHLTFSAVDDAGNTSRTRRLTISLRR